jgi:ABC-2 type transport system permease protein
MIQPRLVWELARKDLLLFAADRRGMLLCFSVPILLASAFGAIFHKKTDNPARPTVLVVSQDQNAGNRRIAEGLSASEQIRASTSDLPSAKRRLASESSCVIVVLPAGIGELTLAQLTSRGNRPCVEIWHHPRNHWEARWVEGILTEIILRESARSLFSALRRDGANELDRPFSIERRAEPAGDALSIHAYSHSYCGMTLQYLLFWGMDSGLLLLRERRQGIWRRLRAAPISRLTLLGGKALATALVALAQIVITFLFGALFFQVTITGSLIGFLLMAVAASLLSAATGLLVAALGGNEGRARSVAILVILTLSLLGGLWLPAFLLPEWVRRLALWLPTTWAARGLEGVTWQGMDLAGALPCAAALTGFSFVFLAVAWWRLVRTEGGVACT